MSSAICYCLDQSKILLSGNGLNLSETNQIIWSVSNLLSENTIDVSKSTILPCFRELVRKFWLWYPAKIGIDNYMGLKKAVLFLWNVLAYVSFIAFSVLQL